MQVESGAGDGLMSTIGPVPSLTGLLAVGWSSAMTTLRQYRRTFRKYSSVTWSTKAIRDVSGLHGWASVVVFGEAFSVMYKLCLSILRLQLEVLCHIFSHMFGPTM